jgi:hypothetical protein
MEVERKKKTKRLDNLDSFCQDFQGEKTKRLDKTISANPIEVGHQSLRVIIK